MKTFPTVISYFTRNTPYEKEVESLVDSCIHHGLETSIEGIDSFGSWELNCAYKPFFILKKLEQLKRPLLWVDADGVFLNSPSWIEAFEGDIALRMHPELPLDHPSRVISSTIYLRPTPAAVALVKRWALECQKELLSEERTLEFWDQIALREALQSYKGRLKLAALPLSYAKIYDHPEDCSLVEEPVIEHFQASRRFKKLI